MSGMSISSNAYADGLDAWSVPERELCLQVEQDEDVVGRHCEKGEKGCVFLIFGGDLLYSTSTVPRVRPRTRFANHFSVHVQAFGLPATCVLACRMRAIQTCIIARWPALRP